MLMRFLKSLNYITDETVVYSWPSLIAYLIIVGVLVWSYLYHIAVVLYLTLALLFVCAVMIQTYASNKGKLGTFHKGKGYNPISFFAILLPCAFLTILLSCAYFIYTAIYATL